MKLLLSGSRRVNLDLITSDQYTQVYLDHLFSDKGPVEKVKNYFTKANEHLKTLRTECTIKTRERNEVKANEGVHLTEQAEGTNAEQRADKGGRSEETETCNQREESLKLSIVETQLEESMNHSSTSA